MPQRPTRANPNPQVAPTIPPAVVSIPVNHPVVEPDVLSENFGRDQNLKTLLKSLQPKIFTGEGNDVPKVLEEWIVSMEDYFALAEYNLVAQGIMGRAKLGGSAKLWWWKLHCQTQGKKENTVGWDDLQKSLKGRYLSTNYLIVKMNEFLSCVRKGKLIDEYYEYFVKLSRYAPLMTEEQKLSRFILGLEGQLAKEINALCPISLIDALICAKSKLTSF